MKKYALCLLAIVVMASCAKKKEVKTDEINVQTFEFAIKGTDTLRLDKYDVPVEGVTKPCVLFVFGGGFVGGTRDHEYNVEYLKRLAERGYVAIGIDYRLGMKDVKATDDTTLPDIAEALLGAIHIAVEDLYDATKYVYDHADAWGINKAQIVANGSSAGALTVLSGEYMICNQMNLAKRLPEGFRYGGIIAFAGAIANVGGDPTWPIKPMPIQLFHGDADRNVPFDKVTEGEYGMYGSKFIAGQLDEMQLPYYLFVVENIAHEMAGSPMVNNLDEITTFIQKYVVMQKPFIINLKEEQIGAPELEKDLDFMDYINTNYQH